MEANSSYGFDTRNVSRNDLHRRKSHDATSFGSVSGFGGVRRCQLRYRGKMAHRSRMTNQSITVTNQINDYLNLATGNQVTMAKDRMRSYNSSIFIPSTKQTIDEPDMNMRPKTSMQNVDMKDVFEKTAVQISLNPNNIAP